ncbi:MAG: hypothetical protein JF617_18660, partial [Burkholderiales bacterium]|nr:hypothetical protein [Burkholderiales bacterium]
MDQRWFGRGAVGRLGGALRGAWVGGLLGAALLAGCGGGSGGTVNTTPGTPTPTPTAEPLSQLKTDGTKWVDAGGKQVLLKGTNLGSWLVQEFWMMGQG